jgi:hypothetical protein
MCLGGAYAPLAIENAVPSSKNLRTALILASIVLAFFVGVILRHWITT